MTEDTPKVVTSKKSQKVAVDGFPFSIEIYRLETEKMWNLEVVDHDGTSHVWDDQFRSDKDARDAAFQEPLLHHSSPLFEQVITSIGELYRTTNVVI